jgi:hypothetical protein
VAAVLIVAAGGAVVAAAFYLTTMSVTHNIFGQRTMNWKGCEEKRRWPGV